MKKTNKNIFDKYVYHSLVIELKDNTFLHYEIDDFNKNILEEDLDIRRDYSNDLENPVLQFITSEGRVVIIKVNEIRNVMFCSDFEKSDKSKEYNYNFDIMINPHDDDEIPDAIIKMVGKKNLIYLMTLIVNRIFSTCLKKVF